MWVTQTTEFETGGSPILSYHLQYDKGTGNEDWVDLVGFPVDSLVTTYTVTGGIVKGTAYRFRLRSKNIYGFGDYSTIATIYSSDVPEQPAPVQTSIDGVNVVITWVTPYDNSEAIKEYDLQIRKSDNITWANNLVDCPRTPVTPTSCTVPMSRLRADFGLTQGMLIVVRVKAANRIEYGDYSEINTDGAVIATQPHKMLPPYQG